jgi:PAS domain S-box-containing protein
VESWADGLALLVESTGEGIFGIDLDGCCTFMNRAGAELLGYRVEQVLGRNMHDLIHHAHADGRRYPVEQCPIFRAFSKGLACRVDSEVLWRADGSMFPAEYSSHPIVDGGVVRGAVVTFVDISERRRADEMLRSAKHELERRVDERTRALTDALIRLRELSAHLDSVRELERTRIAREIHDELGSLLVALKFDVNWLCKRVASQPELERKCRSMGGLIEGAVVNVGRIITDLRPSILDHQGLWAALEWQAHEFAEASELACDTHIELDPRASVPEGAIAIAVFRIFQEMLSNVARHAQASAVRIVIAADASALTIVVTDNGVGAKACKFSSAAAYGVLGMRERAGHFGGEVAIESSPGRGTTVRLQMPLAERAGSNR